MWFVVTRNTAHVALLCFWFSESPVSALSQASVSLALDMCVNTMEKHWEGQLLPIRPAGSLCLLEVWVCRLQVLLPQALWSPVLLCGPRRHSTRYSPCTELLWTPAPHQYGMKFPRVRWHPPGSEKLSGGSSLVHRLPSYYLSIDNLMQCLNLERFEEFWCWPATVGGLWRHLFYWCPCCVS